MKRSPRYAETVVTLVVSNDKPVARDARIDVLLPGDAFINHLTMTLGDNVTVVGSVERKEKAKRIYDKVMRR